MTVLKVNGGARLAGEIRVPGSKNAVLAFLSAIPLVDGVVTLKNVPRISDVRIKVELLAEYGVGVDWVGDTLVLDARQLHAAIPGEEIVRTIRTSFYLFGPLLARLGAATLPMPGGCKIGARPVDFHIKGLHELGARILMDAGMYEGVARNLVGAEIYLDFPSAGATQHLMSTACLAKGITVIQNAAMEPEVIQLGQFLIKLGAKIEGLGTSQVTIEGVERLTSAEHVVPSDRIQAGTYLLAGAITKGDVTCLGVEPEYQTALIQKLRDADIKSEEGPDWVRVWATDRPHSIRVKTMPYPGFPTDIQQPMAALLCLARGSSVIEETIYESRIGHVNELARMGARLSSQGRLVVIDGVAGLTGASVEASDLRAGAALVLAGLAAKGTTTIRQIQYIDRGYESFEENLRSLGADIERVEDSARRSVPMRQNP